MFFFFSQNLFECLLAVQDRACQYFCNISQHLTASSYLASTPDGECNRRENMTKPERDKEGVGSLSSR